MNQFNKTNWWHGNEFIMLHRINKARIDFILKHTHLNKNILDIGCGGGILTEALALQGANMTGVDNAEHAIQAAKNHAKLSNLNINYQCTDVKEITNTFDVILCMEMLEHVSSPIEIIKVAKSLLNPLGLIFFSTINRCFLSYMLAIVTAEYLLKLVPKHTHEFEKFIKPSELVNMLRINELKVLDISGIKYNPITKKSSLSSDVSVNYILVACNSDKN